MALPASAARAALVLGAWGLVRGGLEGPTLQGQIPAQVLSMAVQTRFC